MIIYFRQFESKNVIDIPKIENTMNFWHGGNLDRQDVTYKKGRICYGIGLNLTTHYETANKYAKGNRKLYIITVEVGNDINDSFLPYEKILKFINKFVISSKRNIVLQYVKEDINDDGLVHAYLFNNVILNNDAIKASNMIYLRDFLVENHIDYEINDNAFGWNERMMVLYNMNKIVNIIRVKSTDRFKNYDLK
jgi:hypothetical protein